MYKTSVMLADAVEPIPARTMRLRTVILVVVGIFLIPLAMEGALVCYGQWCVVLGTPAEVQTPVMHLIGQGVDGARESLSQEYGPAWREATREPYYVLPLATICIVAAMVMLKW